MTRTCYKSYKFPCEGYTLEVSEIISGERIAITIADQKSYLTEDQWRELCDLRYQLEVRTPPPEPEENKTKTEKEPNNADESI